MDMSFPGGLWGEKNEKLSMFEVEQITFGYNSSFKCLFSSALANSY